MFDNVKITRTENIDYLQFDRLLEFQDKLVHAIFLKEHEIGFNLDANLETRERSIETLSKKFNINYEQFVQSHQTHSDHIKRINSKIDNNKRIINDFDGFITDVPEIASITTFADCVPVFIYDYKNNVYANIHAGWRGIINKITIKAIKILVNEYKSSLSNIICCIGPNIRKECFLVNDDLVQIYKKAYGDYIKKYPIVEKTDLKNENGKQYRIDNNLLLKQMLIEVGILEKNIINSNICTVCHSSNFHSRRVEGENFQKNGGLMMLKK